MDPGLRRGSERAFGVDDLAECGGDRVSDSPRPPQFRPAPGPAPRPLQEGQARSAFPRSRRAPRRARRRTPLRGRAKRPRAVEPPGCWPTFRHVGGRRRRPARGALYARKAGCADHGAVPAGRSRPNVRRDDRCPRRPLSGKRSERAISAPRVQRDRISSCAMPPPLSQDVADRGGSAITSSPIPASSSRGPRPRACRPLS